MEHFLPLAIASLVISLISIILLDYFGPTSPSPSEKDVLPSPTNDVFNKTEEYTENNLSEESNKEIPLGQEDSFGSNKNIQQKIENQSFTQLNFLLQSKFSLQQT